MFFMLNFFLSLLRIRTIIIIAIVYFFLNISSNGEFNLKLPDLQNLSISNLTEGLKSVKKQVMDLFVEKDNKGNRGNRDNKSGSGGKNNSLEEIKKGVSNLLKSDKSKD